MLQNTQKKFNFQFDPKFVKVKLILHKLKQKQILNVDI